MGKFALIIILSLVGCGGGGGSDSEPIKNVPAINPGDTNCDGDVSFNTVVPDPAVDVPVVDVPAVDSPGIINPAVSKVVEAADYQGLKIIRMEKLDGSTIVVTCGGTVNIGGDGNTSGVPADG
jgi:hypothetical protein